MSKIYSYHTKIKMLAYWLAYELGFERELIKTRSRRPSGIEQSNYKKALNQLEITL